MMQKMGILMKKTIRRLCRRVFSNASVLHKANSQKPENDISRIRNIGILAHIDAGKTTTTERMLFYSGKIRIMGEVHEGNTVTDYMEQERNRGITITSAAVTFHWLNHRFNLIDTPGHIDFTMEVEQALHVMDGAIVILDASAGVEAQTVTVWRQADNYSLPRIAYANKMDRGDANINLCKTSLSDKLDACPLSLQIPLRDGSKLIGILDVIKKQKCLWEGEGGQKCRRIDLKESDGRSWEQVMKARAELADQLTDLDDKLADIVLALDTMDNIEERHLLDSVRRVTLSQKGVPLLCGSSYKNIGVQLLMDSVVDFLPSPIESFRQNFLGSCFKDNLSAKAFKIIHDKQKGGAISFFRIYSGKLSKGQNLHNLKRGSSEQMGKLMVAFADDYEEVHELTSGNIAAVTGLKTVNTGDLVTNSSSAANSARKYLMAKKKLTTEDVDEALGVGVEIPDPVFFCSIEPISLKFQVPLDAALKELQREDPSLHVNFSSETGQTVLGGMGELHLEVIQQRLISEYKVEVDLGPLQIAYKECLLNSAKYTLEMKHKIGGSIHAVRLTLSAKPVLTNERYELLTLDTHPDSASNLSTVTPRKIMLLKQGITSGLLHGPTLGSPVIGMSCKLHWLEVKSGTSESIFIAAASQCVRKLLELGGTGVLEPLMSLEIISDEESTGAIVSDLSTRRATIEQIGVRGNSKTVSANVPLSELLGYSKDLRIMSSGMASFTMEFLKYQQMSQLEQTKVIEQLTGL